MPPGPRATGVAIAFALVTLIVGCEAEIGIERPGEARGAGVDTVAGAAVPVDTVFRPAPIDSAGASFAWVVVRPEARVTRERSTGDVMGTSGWFAR